MPMIDRFMRTDAPQTDFVSDTPESDLLIGQFLRGQKTIAPGADGLTGEFGRGYDQGLDSLQQSAYAVAAMAGRELGIPALEEYGTKGVLLNQEEMENALPVSVGSLAEIEDAGDFFKWAAGGLGSALPSIATTVAAGGIGGVLVRTAISAGLRKTVFNTTVRKLVQQGFSRKAATDAAGRIMTTKAGHDALIGAVTGGRTQAQVLNRAFGRGALSAAVTSGAIPQIGQIDLSLQEAGVSGGKSAITAILGGTAGGLLEALPALRLIDKMFPGVDQVIAKNFIKDLAKGMGIQSILEGSTEGGQEMIQLAALAFHDPSFDPYSKESIMRVVDAFAVGALVGTVTGGAAPLVGGGAVKAREADLSLPDIPSFSLKPQIQEGIVDPDFEPADNTFFEELRGRVSDTVSSVVDPIMNTVQDSARSAIDAINTDLGPGLNGEARRLSTVIADAHQSFVTEHKELFNRVTEYAKDSTRSIYEQAELISDPVKRQEFVSQQIVRVKKEAKRIGEVLKRNTQKHEQNVAKVLEESDIMFEDDLDPTSETQTDPAEVTEARPTKFIFGKESGGRVSDLDIFKPPGGEIQGFKGRQAAENLLERIRKRYPSATEDTFAITQQPDGTYVVELIEPASAELLMEDDRVSRALEKSRLDARKQTSAVYEARKQKRHKDAARIEKQNRRRQFKVTREDGKKTTMDMPTLIFAAKDLIDVTTHNQAVATILGRLMDRGLINAQEAADLSKRFAKKTDAPLPTHTETDLDFDALPPRTKQEINQRVNEQLEELRKTLTKEGIRGKERQAIISEERDALLRAEIDAIDRDVRTQRDLGREEQGDEESFIEQGLGRQLESEEQQARESRSKRPFSKKHKAVQDAFNARSNLKVFMPGVKKEVQRAMHDFVAFVQDKLGMKMEIRLINKAGAQQLIDSNHAHAKIMQRYIIDEGTAGKRLWLSDADGMDITYILIEGRELAIETVPFVLGHELGHQLETEGFNDLTPEMKRKLEDAFEKETRGREEPATGNFIFLPSRGEFKEWFADQVAQWSVTDREAKTAVQKIFKAIGEKLSKLYDFLSDHADRFRGPNPTFREFLDGIKARARGKDTHDYMFQNETQNPNFRLPPIETDDIKITLPRIQIPQSKINQIMQEYEAKYPTIAKRAALIRNWMFNAYEVIAAPGNSMMMRIGQRVPAARQLVRIFGRQEHGKAKKSQNYHQRVNLMKARFMTRLLKAIEGKDKAKLLAELRALDGKKGEPSEDAQAVRKLFDLMHKYLIEAGLPVGKIQNYFPKMFSRQKLIDNKEKIIQHLMKNSKISDPLQRRAYAMGFYNSLISNEAEQSAALRELEKDPLASQAPAFNNMRSRTAKDAFFDQFLDDNIESVMANYVNAAVKRAEYNRFLGSNARSLTKWKARGKLEELLRVAEEQGATDQDLMRMKQFIDANLGMLGRDFDRAIPGARNTMAALMAYQNMRVLMFTVFASLPDMVGPAIRAGSLRDSFKSVSENMQKVLKSDNDLHEMARAWGVISDAASDHIMTEYVDNHYMPPTMRKWNDAFFKYTGLEWYTNFTRKMALAVGIDYIQNQARLVTEGKTEKARFRAKAALKELGISKTAVDSWVAAGKPTWSDYGQSGSLLDKNPVAEALVQFVDESIMRPNPAQRPLLANHPALMLVFHLKGFMYAMYEVFIRRMAHNFRIADTPAQAAAAIAPAGAMIAVTALGLELRELVQYGLSNRTPPSDRMNGWDYTWNLVERAGLLGPTQLAFDFEGANRIGMNGVAAVGGPTLSQFANIISRPPSQTVPKAIPIVGQVPWMRDGLREITPL